MITASGPVDLPIVGTLVPWQLTFMVVSLPGLAIVALMMFTVREPVRRNLAETQDNRIPIRDVVKFMWANRGTFGSIFVGYATGGTAFHGFLFWVPEFIRRSYGWDISDAGMVFGAQLVVLGAAGTFVGGWVCDWLTVRGYQDAALRALAAFFAIAMPFMAITPLMPSAALAIPMLGLAVFTLSLQQALSPVAIQLFTPNQMRAQVMAVFFVISIFFAIAFGAASVAVVTDYVFRDDNDLRYSLAIVSAIAMSAGGDKPGPGNQAVSEEPGAGGGLERFNLTGLAAIAHDFWNPASAGMAAAWAARVELGGGFLKGVHTGIVAAFGSPGPSRRHDPSTRHPTRKPRPPSNRGHRSAG